MKRHYIIPVFVPHRGCPHACVFCNQRWITGCAEIMNTREICGLIEKHLATFPRETGLVREIAFYGGSFTAIPQAEQNRLLDIAAQYKQRGLINSIRISTRPDCINLDSLNFLQKMGVSVIELGVQSMDDEVLSLTQRGHSSCDVVNATNMIRLFDFTLGLQIMLGLPGDTSAGVMATVAATIKLQPDFVRIYPTVVIKDTLLAEMYRNGSYVPLSLAEAVDLGALALLSFEQAAIPVIRMGLQPTKELMAGMIAGPFHPAFRELVESRIAYAMMAFLIGQLPLKPGAVIFHVHSCYLSSALGYKKENLARLIAQCGVAKIRIHPDNSVKRGSVVLFSADGRLENLRISKEILAKLPGMFRT